MSLHDRFTKCPKSSDNTKSSYWRINPDVASKSYVRRRACSMDTTNLKRPLSSNLAKLNNRHSAVTHRVALSNPLISFSNNNPSNSDGYSTATLGTESAISSACFLKLTNNANSVTSLSPLCELQNPIDFNYSSPKILCNRSNTDSIMNTFPESSPLLMNRLGSSSPIHSESYHNQNVNNKLHGFCPYSLHHHSATLCTVMNNTESPWPVVKDSTINNNRNGTDIKETNSMNLFNTVNNNLFGNMDNNRANNLSGFNNQNSTDQHIWKGRSSGLIAQLLRSDHPVDMHCANNVSVLADGEQDDVHEIAHVDTFAQMSTGGNKLLELDTGVLSQHPLNHYLTNSIDNQSQTSTLSVNRMFRPNLFSVPMLTSSSQQQQSSSSSFQPFNQTSHRNNICDDDHDQWTNYRSMLCNPTGHIDTNFYRNFNSPNFLSSVSNNSLLQSSIMDHLNSISAVAAAVASSTASPSVYDSSDLDPHRLLTFSKNTNSLSSPTSSSLCSSSNSSTWRHSFGLDMRLLNDSQKMECTSTETTDSSNCVRKSPSLTTISRFSQNSHDPTHNSSIEDSRVLGADTQANPIYYTQSSLFSLIEPTVEPPVLVSGNHHYNSNMPHQSPLILLKQLDPMEHTSEQACSLDEHGVLTYDHTDTAITTFATSINGGSMNTGGFQHNNREFRPFMEPYLYEDDCEPLELELSLELADRIVGHQTATIPITSDYKRLP